MPGAVGNPPGILSPGRGPNGPGPIDMRRPETSVGARSSVPYGPTLGYATPNGVTGFVGPGAGSLQLPTTWYVRASGLNTNGGSSSSASPERSGTDGVTNSTTTFVSASAAFTSADVGKGLCTGTSFAKIIAVTNATTVVLSGIPSGSGSGKTWAIGGAWADLRIPIGDPAFVGNSKSPVLSGDTIYVGAGTYRQIYAVASGAANWSPLFNGQVSIVGDVDGSHTGDAGMVQLTAYTTNDKTAPSATTLLNLNGKSNLAFSNILFTGGGAALVTATTLTSQNISFTDCAFLQGSTGAQTIFSTTCGYQLFFNLRIDRCAFASGSGLALAFTLTTGSSSNDYNANVLVTNSLFLGSGTKITVTNSGSLTFKGGGVVARSCWSGPGTGSFMVTTASQVSTVFPCAVYNCFLNTQPSVSLNAGTAGQIIEAYNLFQSVTPRTNVTVGAGSVSDGSYAPLFHFGQERIWGALLRPFGEPMAGSPLLGFGSQDPAATLGADLYNRPRPAGGTSLPYPAVGALERGNTFAQQTGTVHTGTNALSITGPGYHDFLVPVDAASTTFSIYLRYDASYAGTLPSIQVLANGQIGVAAATASATAAALGAWEQVSLAAFTPTAQGFVTFRVVSSDKSGAGITYADTFASA